MFEISSVRAFFAIRAITTHMYSTSSESQRRLHTFYDRVPFDVVTQKLSLVNFNKIGDILCKEPTGVGAIARQGNYRQINMWHNGRNNTTPLFHKLVYIHYNMNGEDTQSSMHVSHRCHNPGCFSLAHLILESVSKNQRRKGCRVFQQCHHCSDDNNLVFVWVCEHDPPCMRDGMLTHNFCGENVDGITRAANFHFEFDERVFDGTRNIVRVNGWRCKTIENIDTSRVKHRLV